MNALLALMACAPLPFPKPAPVVTPGAEYALRYCGADYACVLHAGGLYECWALPRTGPPAWAGRWEAKGRTVTVSERPSGAEGATPLTFEVPVLSPKEAAGRSPPPSWLLPLPRRKR